MSRPFLLPATEGVFAEYEEYGVEDPRICHLNDDYLITYSAYSRHGVRVALARTHDFQSLERVAFVTETDSRNVVIFPETFDGLYVCLHRPLSEISPWAIWASRSPDLKYWGDSKVVMKPVQYHWDEMKIGPGATPFRTEAWWLHIYHGVFPTIEGSIYRLGVALHDLSDPTHVCPSISSLNPIFAPMPYSALTGPTTAKRNA